MQRLIPQKNSVKVKKQKLETTSYLTAQALTAEMRTCTTLEIMPLKS
jgi:hypothetical protein